MTSLHPPILVTGAHRTGTTWVGKMLSASGETAYISEPLNVLHRPGVMRAPLAHWYTYICEENQNDYLGALQETLHLKYHPWLELKSLRSVKDVLRMGRDWSVFAAGRLRRQRPLLKDPFAVFSLPWFENDLGCQGVITVRHPAAFANSLKRLNWPFDFSDLLAQPLLMEHWLEPYRQEMLEFARRPDDILGQASLLWRMIYQVVGKLRTETPDLLVVRHEDLSIDPAGGFQNLYRALDLTFNESARQTVINASSAGNPRERARKKVHTVHLNSAANIHNWKRHLDKNEINRVRAITGEIAEVFYPGENWE